MVLSLSVAVGFVAGKAAHAALDCNATVFIIIEENHNLSSLLGSASAPYINGTLLPTSSYCTQYYDPGVHPSEPNYLWLEAGTNLGVTDDNPPSIHSFSTSEHLVTLLDNAGISWKAYEEDVDTANPLVDSYPYAVRHDPFAFFTNVTSNTVYRNAHIVPYTTLASDLQNGTTAHYSFITPNVCDDGHDSCGPTNDPVRQTDDWLAANVPAIINSAAFQANGALFITWDEGEGMDATMDGPIGMIAVSPSAKGGGYTSAVHTTHSSTLKTFQRIFGAASSTASAPYLTADVASASDLSDLFLPNTLGNTVDAPVFTPPPATYSGDVSVSVTDPTPGAAIRYTTDGTAPTANSPLYTCPVTVSATTTLTAAAFKPLWADSAASGGTYSIVAPFTTDDAATALRIAAGIATATPDNVKRLNVEPGSPPTNSVDILDAVRLLRMVNGI